ncbi:YxlC family protein [Sutcliffiella horikoshii]|uniref:YxlC family protein n=1 Tax=Sutcliffiella horikoshii TaxID=79883 RepID=UPI00384C293D
MTKSKQDKREQELITKLQKDWQQLDELGPPPIPTAQQMQEQLHLAKSAKRKAFQKELSMFVITAIILLTAFTTAMFQAPLLFVIIQVSALVVAPIIFYILQKNKAKQEGSILS